MYISSIMHFCPGISAEKTKKMQSNRFRLLFSFHLLETALDFYTFIRHLPWNGMLSGATIISMTCRQVSKKPVSVPGMLCFYNFIYTDRLPWGKIELVTYR
jgi:hypothetical protein